MTTIPSLRREVESRYDCYATLRQIVRVVQQRRNGSIWDGPVVVFNLISHASAETCYAWYDPAPTPAGGGFHAVLHSGSIQSAEAAVASIMGRDPGRTEQAS